MGNYAHLLENNKNGDKGKHANNGSRVQRDTISKVRAYTTIYINILNYYAFVCVHPSIVTNRKLSFHLPITFGRQAKFSFYRLQKYENKTSKLYIREHIQICNVSGS